MEGWSKPAVNKTQLEKLDHSALHYIFHLHLSEEEVLHLVRQHMPHSCTKRLGGSQDLPLEAYIHNA